jgi:hypothetical protein
VPDNKQEKTLDEHLKCPKFFFQEHVPANCTFPVLLCGSLWKHYTYVRNQNGTEGNKQEI